MKKRVIVSLLYFSHMMLGSDDINFVKKVISNFEYQQLHQSWTKKFSEFGRLDQTQTQAKKQLEQKSSKVMSYPGYLQWCYDQRHKALQAKQEELHIINQRLCGIIQQVAMRDVQQVQTLSPNGAAHSVTSDTTKDVTDSVPVRPSYAEVVGRSKAVCFESNSCSCSPISLDNYSFVTATTISDLTTSDIDKPAISEKIQFVADLKAVSVIDPKFGITKLQAIFRGAQIRENLANIQRDFEYKKEQKVKLQQTLTKKSAESIKLPSRSVVKLGKKKIAEKHAQILQLPSDQDDDVLCQTKFFADNPGLIDFIARHGQKAAQNALPQTKEFYSSYKKHRSEIDQHVITPWTQSWVKIFAIQQPGLTHQEYKFCQQQFEQELTKSIRIGYATRLTTKPE